MNSPVGSFLGRRNYLVRFFPVFRLSEITVRRVNRTRAAGRVVHKSELLHNSKLRMISSLIHLLIRNRRFFSRHHGNRDWLEVCPSISSNGMRGAYRADSVIREACVPFWMPNSISSFSEVQSSSTEKQHALFCVCNGSVRFETEIEHPNLSLTMAYSVGFADD